MVTVVLCGPDWKRRGRVSKSIRRDEASAAVGLLALVVLASGLMEFADALDNGLARTPPMGFNSYMAPQSGSQLGEIADFFISSGLHNSGYTFVNTDEGWELQTRSAEGKLQWDPKKFPMGLPKFIENLNARGLKFGIYGAASGVTCGTCPGQLFHEGVDAQTYADWGVSYLKSDNCASYAMDPSVRYGAMRDALNRTGKSIVLSIEPFSINPDAEQSYKVANLWRTTMDIRGTWDTFTNRADINDKWAPLAGPGGFNDPDMINVQNPPGLSLGENRVYFGLWAIMKSPLLLSANLSALVPSVIDIVNNSAVIAVNQDPLGIQARKLTVNGTSLPWLAGLESCAPAVGTSYRTRALDDALTKDSRLWDVNAIQGNDTVSLFNRATNRCLSSVTSPVNQTLHVAALVPCDISDPTQQWMFDMGLSTVSSITNKALGLALAVSNATLYSAQHRHDAFNASDAAYGLPALTFLKRYDVPPCTKRDCQQYDPSQLWYYSPTEGLLRHSLYVASINEVAYGGGYDLAGGKTPTWQHHCVAHVLSTNNVGTAMGATETWGGPLANGKFVAALLNRGNESTTIHFDFSTLEMDGVSSQSTFTVTDLWSGASLGAQLGHFSASIAGHDIGLYQMVPAKQT